MPYQKIDKYFYLLVPISISITVNLLIIFVIIWNSDKKGYRSFNLAKTISISIYLVKFLDLGITWILFVLYMNQTENEISIYYSFITFYAFIGPLFLLDQLLLIYFELSELKEKIKENSNSKKSGEEMSAKLDKGTSEISNSIIQDLFKITNKNIKILAIIGKGCSGTVAKCYDNYQKQFFAIKSIKLEGNAFLN